MNTDTVNTLDRSSPIPLPCTTWGAPNAPKRALLIHGLTCCSQGWFRIAPLLASQGYYVVAPDLPGHGIAPRLPASSYSIESLALPLKPYIMNGPHDLIIAHSLGGIVMLSLLSSIPARSRPTHVVVMDPPLDLTVEQSDFYGGIFRASSRQSPGVETYRNMFMKWTEEDVVWKVRADEMCDPACVNALFDQHRPWEFKYFLEKPPASSVRLTILGGDLECGGVYHGGQTAEFPYVIPKTAKGTSHWVPMEDPQAVVDFAIEGVPVGEVAKAKEASDFPKTLTGRLEQAFTILVSTVVHSLKRLF